MLHVWLATSHSALRVWQATDKAWQLVPSWQALHDKFDDTSVCLYVPTQMILTVTTELPTAQLKQLGTTGKQYLFEEISLTPVEQLRIKQLDGYAQSQHFLYAAATSDINAWQQLAQSTGMDIKALLPDFLLVAEPKITEGSLPGSKATLYHDNETTLVRLSPHQGFAVAYLPAFVTSCSALDEVDIVSTYDHNNLDHKNLDHKHLENSKTNALSDTDGFINECHAFLEKNGVVIHYLNAIPKPIQAPLRHPLNFTERQRQSKLSAYLKIAAITAICACVAQISADTLQLYQYKLATLKVKEATAEQFQYWFEGKSLNQRVTVPLQVRPYLRNSVASQSPQLTALTRISPLLKQSGINAESLSWDDQNLSLMLSSPNRASLDKLVASLNEQGVSVNLGRIESREDGSMLGEVKVTLNTKSDTHSAPTAS